LLCEPNGSRQSVLSKHDIGLNGLAYAVGVEHDAEICEHLARQQDASDPKGSHQILVRVRGQWHEAHDLARRVDAARPPLRPIPGNRDRPGRNRGQHGRRRRELRCGALRTDVRVNDIRWNGDGPSRRAIDDDEQ
jgi:hypothetical protein